MINCHDFDTTFSALIVPTGQVLLPRMEMMIRSFEQRIDQKLDNILTNQVSRDLMNDIS